MKTKPNYLVIAIIAFIIIIFFLLSPLATPFYREFTSESISDNEIVYVNSTEYIEIIKYINSTIWINATEYIPYWINSTIWINQTEYINVTEYLDYPFVDGWNVSISENYIRCFKTAQMQTPYYFTYYNQLTHTLTTSSSASYQVILLNLLYRLTESQEITQMQYDCARIQFLVLYYNT